ncbi:MAG: formylglycine-generating enzyme family protein [Nitrospirae bacterium]|nr:formylglycine-generating enzyme family protein [Nitrospirota bacterium]
MKNIPAILFIILTFSNTTAFAENHTPHSNLNNMVLVKGGCFQMGDIFRDVPSSEKPVHEVCVNDFYLGKYEVTVGEFRQFVKAAGYKTEAEQQDGCHSWVGDGTEEKIRDHNWNNPGFPQTEKDPVVCISWNDANNYIQWLNKNKGTKYRLPTEAEWEYAARSGGKTYIYSWGNDTPSGNVADESAKKELSGLNIWKGYNDGYAYTAPVGSFMPNELGIYDMSGNVYEWVLDWQEDDYYRHSPRSNPKGPDKGKYKILRGGAWDLQPDTARSTSRYWNEAGARAVCMGFRLAHPAAELKHP